MNIKIERINHMIMEEISKILKLNENTIKTRLSRARQKLEKTVKGGIENE